MSCGSNIETGRSVRGNSLNSSQIVDIVHETKNRISVLYRRRSRRRRSPVDMTTRYGIPCVMQHRSLQVIIHATCGSGTRTDVVQYYHVESDWDAEQIGLNFDPLLLIAGHRDYQQSISRWRCVLVNWEFMNFDKPLTGHRILFHSWRQQRTHRLPVGTAICQQVIRMATCKRLVGTCFAFCHRSRIWINIAEVFPSWLFPLGAHFPRSGGQIKR